MKKIIFIIFSLITIVKAQKVEVTWEYPNLDSARKAIGATTGGITKAQLDSAVKDKALQSFVNSLSANLPNLYAPKIHKHPYTDITGLPTGTGGTAEGQNVNLPDITFYKNFFPVDYGKKYLNGTRLGRISFNGYRINPNVSERPDPVYISYSYNMTGPNGNREFLEEAGFERVHELNYDNPGFNPPGDFEIYDRIIPTNNGKEIRIGYYINKTTGMGRYDMGVNQLRLLDPTTGMETFSTYNGVLNLTDAANGVGLYMYHRGTKSTIQLTNIGGVSTLDLPSNVNFGNYGFHWDATGKVKMDAPKVSPLSVTGQNYYKTVTINGETFDVLIRK